MVDIPSFVAMAGCDWRQFASQGFAQLPNRFSVTIVICGQAPMKISPEKGFETILSKKPTFKIAGLKIPPSERPQVL